MDDVLVVGAGPSGAVAAIVLARAGARVRLIDRARFPRHKLCGDTLNPGTLAMLGRLALRPALERDVLRLDGMLVTGPHGVAIEGRYPNGLHGFAISRSVMDDALVAEAVRAGVSFDSDVVVREALIDQSQGTPIVVGVAASAKGAVRQWRAPVVIAADGRRSTLASGLGLVAPPRSPRRWAIGAYFDVQPSSALGEMHIRPGRYIGVAPLNGGLTNVCVVRPSNGGDPDWGDPEAVLRRELAAEPMLRDRFANASLARPVIVLGPLAADATDRAIDGLLLAGDAAGFVDPMTGDGLRFAVRGGELAAAAALEALARGWDGVHARHAAERRREFSAKWRFNRALRAAVERPALVEAGTAGAWLLPGIVRRMIAYAGDCDIARRESSRAQPSAASVDHIQTGR